MRLPKFIKKPSLSRIPSKSNSSRKLQQNAGLTRVDTDLWEHATLLYHAYEWQAAANHFAQISRRTNSLEDQAKCLVNAGLIQARLGDYDLAIGTFEEAVEANPALSVATYLTAVVYCQLRDYHKAETYMELCLRSIRDDHIDYSRSGLDFVLSRACLLEGLRTLRHVRWYGPYRRPLHLDAIAAERLFEAPSRLRHEAATGLEDPGQPPASSYVFDIADIPTRRESVATTSEKSAGGRASPYWSHNVDSVSSPLYTYFKHCARSPKQTHVAKGSPLPSPTQDTTKGPASNPPSGSRHMTWHHRPTTPYTARDARATSDSVRELSSFIRNGGNVKIARVLATKDAKAEHQHVDELRRYLKH